LAVDLQWLDVCLQYVGFLSSFFILGAVGFRYGLLRGRVGTSIALGDSSRSARLRSAAAAAAAIGFIGVVLGMATFLEGLVHRAESKHQSVYDAFRAGGPTTLAQLILLVALLFAFALAWRRLSVGWPIALVAALALALRNALSGRLTGMVNPLHVLGASLWIGTLFVLVVCGLRHMLRPDVPVTEREHDVAEMVHRFSAVGLGGATLLGITGLITAWTHLNPFAALWTTSYGYALIAKLCVVAVVLGLGAWNWRRVGPALGSDGGARRIRRTASVELAFAALVLLITAVLVSLPSPKLPKSTTPSSSPSMAPPQ
jgi:putative copper export protein